MQALAIIGTTVVSAAIGAAIGWTVGERQGGDYNIAPVIYGPLWGLGGGFVGLVISAIVFT